MVVTGWLSANPRPLNTPLGQQVARIETFTNEKGESIYHIVYLQPCGFVIVSADDLVEPIIGFVAEGVFDCSAENPLGALVSSDLNQRVTAVRATGSLQIMAGPQERAEIQHKWQHFISLGSSSTDDVGIAGVASISDVRVSPLLKSRWGQRNVCGSSCYNYYTPEDYPCGCVATSMAQVMRYHRHPTTAIGVREFTIEIEDEPQLAFTRGGDGNGGAYMWTDMVLAPDCSITLAQRQAIAALCHDAGLSVEMDYGPDGSSAGMLDTADALRTVFNYSNAVKGYHDGDNIGDGLNGMINPNLDAKLPVLLGIRNEDSDGHAIVVDGYGYEPMARFPLLYHHLNMGWNGNDDAWYNLPNVDVGNPYVTVTTCVYNIFTSGAGEIISGRVKDADGRPLSGATVRGKFFPPPRMGGGYTATSDAKGIYALAMIPSQSTYKLTATKDGYVFDEVTVTIGRSNDYSGISANRWETDLVGFVSGDSDWDNDVDVRDFAAFASAWLTGPGDSGWNHTCDIASPADYYVDMHDFAVFADHWRSGVK